MIERLQWWITTARAARQRGISAGRNTTYGFLYETSAAYEELRERSAQTHAIIARTLGRTDVPSLLRRRDTAYWVDEGIDFAEHALAVLVTRSETREKLGAVAPVMKADALHPLIWGAAEGRWEAGHYVDAVQRAATALSGQVKDRTGRYELGDTDLMTQAFSLAAPGENKPRLRWPGSDDDLTVKAMRVGILSMAQGAFSAIRNPATHLNAELPRQEALEQLATLSILARWVDKCELIKPSED
jgi:hypothetical protein